MAMWRNLGMKKVTKMRLTDDGWKFIQTDFGDITLSNDFNQYLDMIDPKWREYEAVTDTKNETVKFKFRPIIRKLESAMLKAVEDIFAPALSR
jgi:putative sterol carrier protein